MTTSHKQNPFGLLQHSDSDSDDEFTKNKTKKTGAKDKDAKGQSSKTAKGDDGKTAPKKAPVKSSGQEDNDTKEKHLKSKDAKKQKGVSEEPHPLDRKSGTGISAFDKKPKRGGGGKFNVGNVQDELKGEREAGAEGSAEPVVQEEVEDKSITLEEYYKKNQVQTEAQVNAAKAKISTEVLLKEIGTATKLQNRNDVKIDDKKELVKKKNQTIETAALGMNIEHKELLGFKTGFKTFSERTDRPEKKSGDKPEASGDAQPELKEAKGDEEKKDGDKKDGEGERGGKGGYKGKKYNSNWKGGDRKDNREGGAKTSKPNVEDSSAFPKLG